MRTRHSIFGFATAVAFACALVGCGGGGGDGTAAASAAPPPPPAGTLAPPAASAPRTMGTARAMQTSTENLLYDPMFSTLGNSLAFVLYGDGAHAETPATSPAGPASRVLVIDNATQGQYLLMGQGGSGPFDARVFVSTPDGSTASVYLVGLQDQTAAYSLDPVAGSDQKHGDLTYRLYEAKVSDPIYGSIAFVFDVASTKKMTIAAPELTSATGAATKGDLRPARRVVLDEAARRTVAAVASRPLLPGKAGPSRALRGP